MICVLLQVSVKSREICSSSLRSGTSLPSTCSSQTTQGLTLVAAKCPCQRIQAPVTALGRWQWRILPCTMLMWASLAKAQPTSTTTPQTSQQTFQVRGSFFVQEYCSMHSEHFKLKFQTFEHFEQFDHSSQDKSKVNSFQGIRRSLLLPQLLALLVRPFLKVYTRTRMTRPRS